MVSTLGTVSIEQEAFRSNKESFCGLHMISLWFHLETTKLLSCIFLGQNFKFCPQKNAGVCPAARRKCQTAKGQNPEIHPWRLRWNIIMEVWKIIFLSKWVMAVGSMLTFKGVSINFKESYLASKASLKEYQCSITMQNCCGTFFRKFSNSIPIHVSLQKKVAKTY